MTLVIPYPRGSDKDVIISYLSNARTDGKKTLQVITEKIGNILSLRQCCIYLHWRFPDRDFTDEEVRRCYKILELALRVTPYSDDGWYDRLELSHGKYMVGVFVRSRKSMLIDDIFRSPNTHFLCYNIKTQHGGFGEDTLEYRSWMKNIETLKYEERMDVIKENIKTHRPIFPSFELINLIDDDWAYKYFYDYWSKLPTYERCRDLLIKMGLTKDIVNYIYELIPYCQPV